MGTACYKSKKPTLNKVQDSPTKDEKEKEANANHNSDEELKEKQMAKLSTTLPANNIIDQLNTQKSLKEEETFNLKLLERSRQGSINVFHCRL